MEGWRDGCNDRGEEIGSDRFRRQMRREGVEQIVVL
jgi:hypothetical protein